MVQATTLGRVYNPQDATSAGYLDQIVEDPGDVLAGVALSVSISLCTDVRFHFAAAVKAAELVTNIDTRAISITKQQERGAMLELCQSCLDNDVSMFS